MIGRFSTLVDSRSGVMVRVFRWYFAFLLRAGDSGETEAPCAYGSSLNGLKILSPGRLKSRSFPVAIVNPCRRAVAAM